MEKLKRLKILIVEDNPDHVLIALDCLEALDIADTIEVVSDGHEALEFIEKGIAGKEAGFFRPDLILLDLNLPRIGGMDVLRKIKASESMSEIPVVVVSTTSEETEMKQAMRFGASQCITKPLSRDRLFGFLEQVLRSDP